MKTNGKQHCCHAEQNHCNHHTIVVTDQLTNPASVTGSNRYSGYLFTINLNNHNIKIMVYLLITTGYIYVVTMYI